MRLLSLLVLLAAVVALVGAEWTKDDYEIFDLQAGLEKDEGAGTTFYSILNLTKGASAAEIRKAYRARSMELHPDKHPDNTVATRRFERLGIINKILRDERRDRYDHFLTNGFPRWRGTGYFYARYRPGLGFVLLFLTLMTSAIQLVILNLNYRRDSKRLNMLIANAKLLAWGPRFRSIEAGLAIDGTDEHNKNIIVAPEKKVRVPLSGIDIPPLAPRGAASADDDAAYWDNDEKAVRKAMATRGVSSNMAECGGGGRKHIDALVTRDEGVFIMDPSSNAWMPLDASDAAKPSWLDTWPCTTARSVLAKAGGGSGSAPSSMDDGTTGQAEGYTVPDQPGSGKKNKNKKKKQQ